MENKKILKQIWIGSGIILLLIAIFLTTQILKLGIESETPRYLSEPLFSTIKGMVVHGLIGLIYIFFNQKPSFKKKWVISGIILYLSILIPVLLFAISNNDYLLGGIFYAQWMLFAAFLMFFYLLFNFIYVIHMGFKKLLSKKR